MKILTSILVVSGALNSPRNQPADEAVMRHIIGKWEIRTYGHQFKKDGAYILFNPDDGSILANGKWKIKDARLCLACDGKEQLVKVKITGPDSWEWQSAPDRIWEANRIK
jgi:hypothetical protein